MAMNSPPPAEVTAWVETTTAEQGLPFGVADQGTVTAAVALLREGRRPEPARAARPGGSG
jgi:hypothetical protein